MQSRRTHPSVSSASAVSSSPAGVKLSKAELLIRTVHLRCLPPLMKQKDLARLFDSCGDYTRVRICGNATVHQKWIYGFVEFTTAEAAAAMLQHSGVELPSGSDRSALRLKCSPSKQPILDCMAYDADLIRGVPCGFGRGYLADCTLNDALLVVANANSNDRVPAAVHRTLTALTVRSIRRVAGNGSGCGCAGVNCCSCCQCWKQGSDEGGVTMTQGSCCGGQRQKVQCCNDIPGGTAEIFSTSATPSTAVAEPLSDQQVVNAVAPFLAPGIQASLLPTVFQHHSAQPRIGIAEPLQGSDLLKPSAFTSTLAAAMALLQASKQTEEQLDGPAILRQAETMLIGALRMFTPTLSDAHLQAMVDELRSIIQFLDRQALVTGGAAHTGVRDCTSTIPQRTTQLRLLLNLLSALLCLLRRSVAEATPFVEAIFLCYSDIPAPSQQRSDARAMTAPTATAESPAPADGVPPPAMELDMGTSEATPALLYYVDGEPTTTTTTNNNTDLTNYRDDDSHGSHDADDDFLSLNVFQEGNMASSLLRLLNEDEEDTAGGEAAAFLSQNAERQEPQQQYHRPHSQQQPSTSTSESIEESAGCCGRSGASLETDEAVVVLRQRDEAFHRYVLNVLVAIGLAMEAIQPEISRSTYSLAASRAREVLGSPCVLLEDCLTAAAMAVTPQGLPAPPRLCEALFAGCSGPRDITFFPRLFFQDITQVSGRLNDTKGTECFWKQLPPRHCMALF